MRPFVLIGSLCIVAGGLVAAVTGPTGFEDGAWMAAYLVLVAGVAQAGLGAGQALLSTRPPTHRTRAWEALTWNAGNVAVLIGTLTGVPALVTVGGLALFLALVMFIRTVQRPHVARTRSLAAYRLLAGLLALSIPVGLVLSAIRHG